MNIFKNLSELKLIRAFYSGLVAAVFIFLGAYLTGTLGETEARVSIREMRPSLRFICSAVLTATSTILALLLTLISFSVETDRDLKSMHYKRIQWIARLCTFTFVAAVILLMSLSLPLDHSDVRFEAFYKTFFYLFLVYGALLGGAMISIVLMLYRAATAIILLFHPDRKPDFVLKSHPEKKERKEKEKQEEAAEPSE